MSRFLASFLSCLIAALAFGLMTDLQAATPPAKSDTNGLVYSGEPLVLPLECRAEDLMGAGLVCNEDSPCELFLELLGLGKAGQGIFVVGDVHTSAVTVSSVLLASSDQGTTWKEPAGRIPAAGFELIQFVDDEHGWIGGQAWDVGTSSRPFLLVTQNGGKRWERWGVWSNLDERSGAILDFYFETPEHGFLIVDRLVSEGDPYEMYESMNGGRSWSIRRVSSEKLKIRRRLSAETGPAWRLHEDEEAGAYAIERQVDGAWSRVASFSSRVGTCRAMQTEEELTRKAQEEAQEAEELTEAEESEEAEETAPSGVFRLPKRR